jgi:hypothetical protein
MAKNFTQFQQISGTITPGLTGDVTRSTGATKDMHVVGYSSDVPDGERRFTIESLLFVAAPSSIGLEHVTNESKETMFESPTFTGNVTADGDLTVQGDLVVGGTEVITDTLTTLASAGQFENNNTSDVLEVIQQDNTSTYNIAKFMSDTEPAMIIASDGQIGVGIDPDGGAVHNNTKLHVLGNIYATTLSAETIDGRNVNGDGIKLDTIMSFSDSTVMVLSSVKATMEAIQNDSNNLLNVGTPKRGFDLLEEGDVYTKVEILSSGPSTDYINGLPGGSSDPSLTPGFAGYGLWDASSAKLYGVESGSDKTGAHSADITYNDVPDGPWTGQNSTTHVKMLSAEREKLTNIRTVSASLYANDPGSELEASDIVAAYQDDYSDYWSSANEVEYRSTIIPMVSASVRNKIATGTNAEEITASGVASLTDVTSDNVNTQSLTAETNVYVVSGGVVLAGIDEAIDVGGDILHFVNGILVRVDAE